MTPDQRLEELDRVLAEVTDEGDGMMLSEFDGLCTALVIGPELVGPSEWLPIVWGGDGPPKFQNPKELQRVLDLLMQHYNDVVSLLAPPNVQFSPVYDQDERNGDVYWESWVSGFERGMRLRPDAWTDIIDAAVGTEHNEAGNSIAMMLELSALSDGSSELTEGQIEAITEDVPQLIADLVFNIQHWTSTQRQPAPFPSMAAANMPMPPRTTSKAGRNEPCPCGSGRKYKKCCGAN